MIDKQEIIKFLSVMRTKQEIMDRFQVTKATVDRWIAKNHGEYVIERTIKPPGEPRKFRLTRKDVCYNYEAKNA